MMMSAHSALRFLQKWAVPFLLMVVAGRQILLSQTQGLSAWHGGGFGMFASIDRDERRLVSISATNCEGDRVAIAPTRLLSDREWVHLKTVPDKALLQSVGDRILAASIAQPPLGAETEASADGLSSCLQQVQIQVWRLRHRRHPGEIWYEPVTPTVEVNR